MRNPEATALHFAADEATINGDVVAAIVLDDLAYRLERGEVWDRMLDDVEVRESRGKVLK